MTSREQGKVKPSTQKQAQPVDRKKTGEQDPVRKRFRTYTRTLLIIAVAAYIQTLTFNFTYDDIPIVRDNSLIRSLANVGKIFQTNYWGESQRYETKYAYRPLTILTYAVQYAIHGIRPFGYHLVNVLLHALACFLLFRLVALIWVSVELAFFVALLFAVHPIHTEAVAGVVGRGELLAGVGVFLCAWAYFRAAEMAQRQESASRVLGWLALSIGGYAVGTFSKETGILAPAVILLTELLFPERRFLLRLTGRAIGAFLGYGLVAGVFLYLRAQATVGTAWVIDFADLTTFSRILTALWVAVEYVGLLIFPAVLRADYPPANIHLVPSLADPAAWGALAALAAVAVLVIWSWRRLPVACWGLLMFLGTLFPVSNLPFAVGVMKAERLLYTPSAGFFIAVVCLAAYLLDFARNRSTLWTVICLASSLFLVRTLVRNEDWSNNYNLAMATMKTAPTSQRIRTTLVNWYREHGQNELAREVLTQGGRASPNTAMDSYNLGNIELDAKRYGQAIKLYEQVLDAQPDNASALNNMGRALVETGQFKRAIDVFEKLRTLVPDNPGPYVNLLDLYVRIGNMESALPVVEDALRRFPQVDVVQWNAGVVYEKLGRSAEAKAAFDRAIRLNPAISGQEEVVREL